MGVDARKRARKKVCSGGSRIAALLCWTAPGEKSEDEENEQRPRSSFSGFSGVVPTQITAPAREPRERLNDRLSVHLRASK